MALMDVSGNIRRATWACRIDTPFALREEHRQFGEVELACLGVRQTSQDTCALLAQHTLDELSREAVVAGVDRRVRCEHALLAHVIDVRLDDGAPVMEARVLLEEREGEEAGVALVHVVGVKIGVAEGAQHSDAADSQHDLLAEPVADIAAVK